MDVFRFMIVKRLCEPFCPPHRPITQICTLKLVPMGEHKGSPIRTNLRAIRPAPFQAVERS